MSRRGVLVAGLVVSLILAGVVSGFASGSPDGLEHAARQGCTVDRAGGIDGGTCMAQGERDHALSGSPLAGYGWRGLGDGPLGTGLAGVLGVLVTFALAGGGFWLLRRRSPARAGPE